MYIGTIHAYAKRVLEDHFGFGNYTVLDDNQEIAFLMRHGWGLGVRDYNHFYAEACRTFLRTVNMVWDELIDEKTLQKRAPKFFERMMRYEELLSEQRLLTFGRLIHEAVLRLRESPHTLNHVKFLIVDEYQDINRAQAEFIALIAKEANIFVAGDQRQSIYRWQVQTKCFLSVSRRIFHRRTEFQLKRIVEAEKA